MPLHPPQDFRNTDQTHRIGTAANRPAAANVLPGTLYFSTDTLVLERSDGTAWASYSPAPVTWINTTFAAGDYTANSSTWTVASGDVTTNRSIKNGTVLIWTIAIAATSTIGAGNTSLSILLPNSYTTSAVAGSFVTKPGYVFEAGAVQLDFVVQVSDATHIVIHRGGGGMAAGAFAIYVTITMEVDL